MLVVTLISRTAAAQTGSVVTVDSNNVLVLNGKKEFIIGFSPGPPNNSTTPEGNDALQELRDAGGLLFRINQSSNWSSALIAQQQTALDWAEQHGMFCWVNLRELSEFATGDTNTAASLANIVDTFRNHPALGLWKNFDEAWWSGISVSNLYNGYVVIKQEDTNHPVVQTHAPRGTVTNLQPYNIAADILALDIYPVAIPAPINPPITNSQISQVGDWTDVLGQVAEGQKAYWLIEQIAFSGTTPPNHTLVFPTFTQSRFMAYEALIDGARGLMFFGGNVTATLNAQDAPCGWNWTFWTNVLKPVVQQLGDHSQLAPALVAPNSTLPITMSGTTSPDIEWCVREAPPYLYILACKREGTSTNVTFSGLPSWAGVGEVLYEVPRTITAHSGQFTDTFAPFDVHVYRFAQSNVPPVILYNPSNQTNIVGTTASFSVSADGTGPLVYQWCRNGTNLVNGGNVSGATTPTLTLTGVSQSDAANYSAIVSGFGSVTSAPASLSLLTNTFPTITSQPSSVTNVAGSTTTFIVAASGLGLTYQWMQNGAPLVDGAHVSGSLTPTLTLTAITSSNAASYSVVVSNSVGAQTSSNAVLTVTYPFPFYEPFNYPAGANLGGQTSPNYLVWSDVGTSTTGPYVTIQSNNLAVAGLMAPSGKSIRFGGLGRSSRLSFPAGAPFTTGTLYYSFALQVLDITGLSSSGVFIAGFNNSIGTQTNQPTVVGTRLYVRSTNGGFNLAVAKNSSTTTDWVWDPRTFTTNQILFIIGSYTFNNTNSSDDVSMMWINPDSSTFGATNAPTNALLATNGSDITANQIASFVFLQRATNEPPAMIADELRIGTNWASVTPVTLPSITRLGNFARLPNGLFQFSFTNTTGQGYHIYGSTNLVDWYSLGAPVAAGSNLYQFTDSTATNYSRRFYQLRAP